MLRRNLETTVGLARGAGEAGGWQGVSAQRAPARKREQRGQRTEAAAQRAGSGRYRSTGLSMLAIIWGRGDVR